jgi:hypothetical protein
MKITTTIPFKEWWETIKSDFKTPVKEIKEKSYDWHWIGGLITFIGFLLLMPNYWQQPEAKYIFAFVLSLGVWFLKEFFWGLFEYATRDGKRPWLAKPKTWKIFGLTPFAWSKPDWKDWRFSIYGSLPFTLLIYLFTKKK